MAAINCFRECLRWTGDDLHQPHPFKLKKGVRCITREKRKSLSPPARTIPPSLIDNPPPPPPGPPHPHLYDEHQQHIKIRRLSTGNRPAAAVRSTSVSSRQSVFIPRVVFAQAYCLPKPSADSRSRSASFERSSHPSIPVHPPPFAGPGIKIQSHKEQTTTAAVVFQALRARSPQPGIGSIPEESEEKEKASSLFQGARSIVSRFVTSKKKEQGGVGQDTGAAKTLFSPELCPVICTHSSIVSSEVKATVKEISLQQIPTSPTSKSKASVQHFRTGRLLGVGKWAHVYLCQDRGSNSVYAIKQIFKESFKSCCSGGVFNKEMGKLISLSHPHLMDIVAKFDTPDKICLLLEYCNRSLFQELREKGLLPIAKVRKYAAELVSALVYLHENGIVHGSVNIFQLFTAFDECKLKHSVTQSVGRENLCSFSEDIQGLAIVVFQLGHGLLPILRNTETLYEKEKMYSQAQSRDRMVGYIRGRIALPENSNHYRQLNQFVEMLLNWQEGCRLTSSLPLGHPFLRTPPA